MAFALTSSLIVSGTAPVSAQGIYDELKSWEKKFLEPVEKYVPPTAEERCSDADRFPKYQKCKRTYLREGYEVELRGFDRKLAHGIILELLTKDKSSVICFGAELDSSLEIDPLNFCVPMKRVR